MNAVVLAMSRSCLMLAPMLCLAQAPDLINGKILEELKSIRASLERLEKSNKALLALTRLETDQRQLAALQERRQRLSAQEQEMTEKVAVARRVEESSVTSMSQSEGGAPDPLASTRASLARTYGDQNASALKEVTASRQALEQEIARLSQSIATMQKYFEDALR